MQSSLAIQPMQIGSTITFIIFTLFGIANLEGWNTWIQQTDYLRKRLVGSIFSASFEAYISLSFQTVNIATLILFLCYPAFLNVKFRFYIGFGLIITSFLAAMGLPYAEGLNGDTFFFFTLICVCLASFGGALLSAMVGLAATYSSLHMSAFAGGQGIAGLLPALSHLILPNGNFKATFIICIIIELLAATSYSILRMRRFSAAPKYTSVDQEEALEIGDEEITTSDVEPTMFNVFAQIREPCIAIFVNLAITLSVFPALTSQVQSQTIQNLVSIHFVVYALSDFIGKSSTIFMAAVSPRNVSYLTLCRAIFIPLILFSNVVLYTRTGARSTHYLPLFFGDEVFLIIMFFFGFSNGVLTTFCFVNAPLLVVDKSPAVFLLVGDLTQLFLALGLLFGSFSTFLLQSISCYCNPF